MKPFQQALLLIVAVGSMAGCGGNPLGRQPVEGRVLLDGEPLASGSIEFAPLESNGVSSGATVADGVYSIAAERGLPSGKYTIRIFSSERSSKPLTPEEAALPAVHRPGEELIAAEFNTRSQLQVEVADGTSCRFDFRVQSRESQRSP